ncbi:MAG: cell division protein SepF [Candidatus Nanohaloarchaea archaeon]
MALGFLKPDEGDGEELVEDEFVELDAKSRDKDQKVIIRAETLREFDDVKDVQKHLREDRIVWVNIKPLKETDMSNLKRAVKRLKKTVRSIDGDMAGVDEEWIVVCPSYAEIARSDDKVEEKEE